MSETPAGSSDSRPSPAELRWPWKNLYFPLREVIGELEPQWIRASTLVRLFYAFMIFQAVSSYNAWIILMERQEAQPLWPLFWTRFVPWEPAMFAIGLAFIFGAVAAALFPTNVIARLAAFLGMFLFESAKYSFGKISHNHHLIVGAALILIFLPRVVPAEDSRERSQRRYLEVFWAVQAYILLTYSMAGIAKLHGAVLDMLLDRRSLLSVEALASHIAHDYVSRGKSSALGMGEFIIANPWLGGPLFWGAVALEFFSFAIAWKPGLHRLWGMSLIGLHVGIGVAMEVWFRPVILMIGIFLLASPFAPAYRTFSFGLRDVPWLGPFLCGLWAEMRSQREKGSSKAAEVDHITVYLRPGWRFEAKIKALLSEPESAERFQILSMDGAEYRSLAESFPYLRTPQFMVVDSGRGESRQIRAGAEACLWALAHLRRSGWRNGFALLLIPNPLLELALARMSRSSPANDG